jgi:uncharacterized protein YggE
MEMTKRTIELFLTVAAMTLLSADAAAQQSLEKHVPSISVTGEARITVKPDQALIDIGVFTQAETAQARLVLLL